MKNVKVGEIKTLSLKNKTLNGFLFDFYMVWDDLGGPDSIAGAAQELLDENILLKLVLERNGKRFTLFQENLKSLNRFTNFLNARFVNYETANQVAYSEGVQRAWVHKKIQLPGVINLKGSDLLELEMNFQDSALAYRKTGQANKSLIYCSVSHSECIGYETHTPYIKSYVVSANDPTITKDLGNNIGRIAIIDQKEAVDSDIYEGTNIATMPLENVYLSADKISINDNFVQLINKRYEMFTNTKDANKRGNSFIIYEDENNQLLDQTSIELKFIPERVTAGQIRLMWEEYYTDQRLLAKAEAQSQLHNIENAVKAGVPMTADMKQAKTALEAVKETTNLDKK